MQEMSVHFSPFRGLEYSYESLKSSNFFIIIQKVSKILAESLSVSYFFSLVGSSFLLKKCIVPDFWSHLFGSSRTRYTFGRSTVSFHLCYQMTNLSLSCTPHSSEEINHFSKLVFVFCVS